MRNFGLGPRSTSIRAATHDVEARTRGTSILATSGIVLMGLAIVVYALTIGFG
jgi:hypothetical protein